MCSFGRRCKLTDVPWSVTSGFWGHDFDAEAGISRTRDAIIDPDLTNLAVAQSCTLNVSCSFGFTTNAPG